MVTGIEFTFEGDDPENKGRLSLLDSFSVLPEDEIQIIEAALEAYKKKRPVEVFEDRQGRIVKIQPTGAI